MSEADRLQLAEVPVGSSVRQGALKWMWLSVLVVLLDQTSKQLAEHFLHLYQPLSLLPSFNLTLMYNKGAAFSFLSDAGGWQRWLFVALAFTISLAIVWWIKGLDQRQWRLAAALALILGGALGNLIDRLLYGHVIDFLDLYYADWHWPAFNVADSAITVGAVLMVIDSLLGPWHSND